MPELKMVFGVGNVDAIGEKTCLQAKAAFFPLEMLFFHGCFHSEKQARGVVDTPALRDPSDIGRSPCVVFDGDAWTWHLGAFHALVRAVDHDAPNAPVSFLTAMPGEVPPHGFRRGGMGKLNGFASLGVRRAPALQADISRMPICFLNVELPWGLTEDPI